METEYKAREWDAVLRALKDIQILISLKMVSENLEGIRLTENQIEKIFREISNSKYSSLVDLSTDEIYIVRATSVTQEFLDNGGFLALYQIEEQRKLLERAKLTDEASIAKKDNMFWWLPLIISAIGLLVAILAYYRPTDTNTSEKLNHKVDSLKIKVNQLQNGLKHENDSLKNKLYKAEMMVKVYEAEIQNEQR